MDYRVIEYKEVLHEAFAGLLADISNSIAQKGISPKNRDSLIRLETKTAAIWREILGPKYSTMEDMLELKRQFEFIQSHIKGLS